MRPSLNIVFAGTPEFGLPCLIALQASHHSLSAVYTQPDRPSGRGRMMQASCIKTWAIHQGIPVYQPVNFKDASDRETLKALKPDLLVVIAYGLILPESVLQIPSLGCVNVHASLLPRWRGASPIQHAILKGDTQSGISVMRMDKGMDTGDVITQVACSLDARETSASLHDKLARLAVAPLLDTIDALAEGRARFTKQEAHHATYAGKIQKTDAKIDWHQAAEDIARRVRAYTPWPIAFTHLGETLLRVHEAEVVREGTSQTPGTILQWDATGLYVACKQQILRIHRLQFPGGKIISAADYLHAHPKEALLHQVLS